MIMEGPMSAMTRPGVRVKLPLEGKLEDVVRSNLGEIKSMSKKTGISRDVYTLARKLVILRDRKVLSPTSEELIDQAFQILEQGDYGRAIGLVRSLLDKFWQSGTHSGTYRRPVAEVTRTRTIFDKTIFAVREICSNIDETAIPAELNRDGRADAADVLVDSICSLTALLSRIKKGPDQ